MTDKGRHRFPLACLSLLLVCIFLYGFSYYFPFTNNAFVVANIRPVAANVSGYVTNIHVENEAYVKKGTPLFTVFQMPYQLAYQKAKSDVEEARARLKVLTIQAEKTQFLVQSQQETYEQLHFEYTHNQAALREHAVSQIKVNNLLKQNNADKNKLEALKKELELTHQKIIAQKMRVNALAAVMDNAKVDLDETVVYAKNNGIVHNLFMALGTPVEIRKPLFSFVDTDTLFIQANFNETDLRHVRAGDKVTIRPRIYFGTKAYKGVVVSNHWAASRQVTDGRSLQQVVTNNEDNWLLLPQRFPVQIKILDYDQAHYPLGVGASAYVHIHTR